MEKNKPDFVSYKKLVIFGTKKTGKTTMVSKMEGKSFSDEYIETKQSNIFFLKDYLFRNKI